MTEPLAYTSYEICIFFGRLVWEVHPRLQIQFWWSWKTRFGAILSVPSIFGNITPIFESAPDNLPNHLFISLGSSIQGSLAWFIFLRKSPQNSSSAQKIKCSEQLAGHPAQKSTWFVCTCAWPCTISCTHRPDTSDTSPDRPADRLSPCT
jgi:hypothetical protein